MTYDRDDMPEDDEYYQGEYFGPPAPTVFVNHFHYANAIDIGRGIQATIADGVNRAYRHVAIGKITMKPKA